MSRSLIRKNQLHPDIADLVGQYGSGFFISDEQVFYKSGNQTISGVTTFATGIFAPNLVYNTGNQTISGIKTFSTQISVNNIRPILTGTPPVVNPLYIDVYNGILGHNIDFIPWHGLNWKSGVLSSNNGAAGWAFTKLPTVNGTGVLLSGEVVAQLPNTIVYNTGNQTISGVKTFATGVFAPNLVYNTGDQTISGVKTFATGIVARNITISGADITAGGQVPSTLIQGGAFLGKSDGTTGVLTNVSSSWGPTALEFAGVNFNITAYNNLSFTAGNFTQLWLDTNGKVGIGTSSPSEKLQVSGNILANNLVYNTGNQTISGVKTFANSGIFSLSGALPLSVPTNPLSVVGSGNTYVQVNIQNRATGTNATADLVITANNGTDTANFINLGINNSGYSDPAFTNGTGLDGYLFIDGGNLDIGTRTPGRAIEFHAGGTTAGSTIARISQSGLNVVSGNLTVNNTGVLLTGQNVFVLQGGTTQTSTTAGVNYIGLAGAHLGWASSVNSRRTAVLENCVARKATIVFHQSAVGPSVSNITGLLINTTRSLTGTISTTMNATNDNNFYNFNNNNLDLPFSAGDSGVVVIQNASIITELRAMVNVYFYS